ncbi:MAG: PIN domain-containing protein [Burkholderiaceae bacterium]
MVASDKCASPALPDVVVVDTCVLMSNVVRCLLLDLARQACIKLAWSPVIGDEWRRNAARIWSVSPAAMQHQWEALQQEFPGADQGDIGSFKGGLVYSDRKDWHVIAAGRAALAKGAGQTVAILTRNIKDFNRSELRRLGLSLFDPDQFLVACLRQFPEQMPGLIERLPVACTAARHAGEPLGVILKRERLFRLNRLCDS